MFALSTRPAQRMDCFRSVFGDLAGNCVALSTSPALRFEWFRVEILVRCPGLLCLQPSQGCDQFRSQSAGVKTKFSIVPSKAIWVVTDCALSTSPIQGYNWFRAKS